MEIIFFFKYIYVLNGEFRIYFKIEITMYLLYRVILVYNNLTIQFSTCT